MTALREKIQASKILSPFQEVQLISYEQKKKNLILKNVFPLQRLWRR